MAVLLIVASLFMIGAPIYAFIYPSITSAFFAGMAVMLLIEVIASMIQQRNARRNYGLMMENLQKNAAALEKEAMVKSGGKVN